MYNRILVPLDGSRFSEGVLPEVLRLAAGTPATVYLLAVAPTPEGTKAAPITEPLVVGVLAPGGVVTRRAPPEAETKAQALEQTTEETEQLLESRARDLRMSHLTVETAVRFGDPVEEILGYAAEHHVEVIVMATHGRTGLPETILGSVARRVVQNGKFPVVLVRPPWLEKGH